MTKSIIKLLLIANKRVLLGSLCIFSKKGTYLKNYINQIFKRNFKYNTVSMSTLLKYSKVKALIVIKYTAGENKRKKNELYIN